MRRCFAWDLNPGPQDERHESTELLWTSPRKVIVIFKTKNGHLKGIVKAK